jgi:tRNA (guanosine-2'-O-)-methyltransferase
VPTEKRIARVREVLAKRQPDLRVVLDAVSIAHNASAVARTCDACGVLYLDIIAPQAEALKLNEAITTRADKWLEWRVHRAAADCLPDLKKAGFRIVAAEIGPGALPYDRIDYTTPTALVFGSEAAGLTPEALSCADETIAIPMVGMVQSLNLSVSVAVVLYEAFRQRQAKGMYDRPRLSPSELERLERQWLRPD